jgi:ribosomal protein L11 methyltransferase
LSAPLRWTEVRVLAPLEWHELVADALTIGPCTSVAFGRPSLATNEPTDGLDFVRTFIPSHADSAALRTEIARSIASLAERTGADELADLALTFRELPPEDYATSWKKSWKPFRVGRLCVVAPWSDPRPRASDVVMRLEPGGAFGSGRHATTRMCLRAIQERTRRSTRLLDAGSGSGILAVAAILFGAQSAHGFDIDPNARPSAEALAEENSVAGRCRFTTSGFEAIESAYDAVVANIYADVIQANARVLRDALAPNGWFAFSGCTRQHAAAVRDAIESSGLTIEECRVRGRWHTFVGTRGSGSAHKLISS